MHTHFSGKTLLSKEKTVPNGHYHEYNGVRTNEVPDLKDPNGEDIHRHSFRGMQTTPPVNANSPEAVETADGNFKVTVGNVTRNMTEKDFTKELEGLEILNDADIQIAKQMGNSPVRVHFNI